MATVIFKPTEACNARCVYCDVVHKEAQLVKTMPEDILETFFVRINEFLLAHPQEKMTVIWHGGEPLLLGPEYFATALAFQEKHCAGTAGRIDHSIQSNLTLLTVELIAILKRLGITSMGTSYDPASDLRRLGAATDSAEYNRRFMAGVALLERAGMDWGLIYVVTKLALAQPREIFYHLTNFCPGGINLNAVIIYDDQMQHLRISPEEYADFLGAIFPVWWRNRARYPQISPLSSLLRNLVDGSRELACCESGSCADSHINLAPDGRLSQCGRSSDWQLLDYGSLADKTFAQVLADPQREMLRGRDRVLAAGECRGCRFWAICHGGCPLDAWYDTGSFMHKSFWCEAKKILIARHIEPLVCGRDKLPFKNIPASSRAAAPAESAPAELPPAARGPAMPPRRVSQRIPADPGERWWINPIGGLGDALMLAGVLHQVSEQDQDRKFNLVKRTKYLPILAGHPAIARIGHPPPGAKFISTAYWDEPDYGTGPRAYQLLARMFGLTLPVPERLYVPGPGADDAGLLGMIPWRKHNVVICPTSESPRKQVRIAQWEELVQRLQAAGIFVAQVGSHDDIYVRGSYNLLGLTTPRQLIALLPHFNMVVTSDNFIMHAAHVHGIPALVFWGPTSHRVYGYPEQTHIQAEPACTSAVGCIGAGSGDRYATPCPEPVHCMSKFAMEEVCLAAQRILREPAAEGTSG